jgi:hypothetical protein
MFIVANTVGNVYARLAITGLGVIYIVIAFYFLGYEQNKKNRL